MTDAVKLNCAIIEAFGLDPKTIRPDATIRLDRHRGPVLTVEHILRDDDEKPLVAFGQLATVFAEYRLVLADEHPDNTGT